jgi:hypothetical protein
VIHGEALTGLREIAAKPVFATALPLLKTGAELALRLDDRIEFALFWRDNQARVEERSAQADLEISFSSEALRQLRSPANIWPPSAWRSLVKLWRDRCACGCAAPFGA